MKRQDAWEEARRLVVDEGWGYREVAKATGVAMSTLEKRASREGWRQQRKVACKYSDQVRALKAGLLQLANDSIATKKDPSQFVYAWKQAEAAYPEHRYNEANPRLRNAVLAEVMDEAVGYLQETDVELLAAFQPHIRPIAERLEAKWAA